MRRCLSLLTLCLERKPGKSHAVFPSGIVAGSGAGAVSVRYPTAGLLVLGLDLAVSQSGKECGKLFEGWEHFSWSAIPARLPEV